MLNSISSGAECVVTASGHIRQVKAPAKVKARAKLQMHANCHQCPPSLINNTLYAIVRLCMTKQQLALNTCHCTDAASLLWQTTLVLRNVQGPVALKEGRGRGPVQPLCSRLNTVPVVRF